jgi:hypothetical protein
MKGNIEELEAREAAAVKVLSSIRQEIRDYWIESHKEVYGVCQGAIVLTRDKKRAIVVSVEGRESHGKPWVKGRIEKKDGTFGAAIRNIYGDWEIYKEV